MICPFATWRPVGNHGGAMVSRDGLVVHVQDGTGSLAGWFDNPASQVSSHFWVSLDGALEQYVDTDLQAWAQLAGNPDYLSVETEGDPADALTAAQVATVGRLFSWVAATYAVPLATCDHDALGLTTHAHYPSGVPDPAWGDHACPGPARAAQLPAILAAAGAAPALHPLEEETMKFVTVGEQQYLLFADQTKWEINSAGFSTATVTTFGDPGPSEQVFVDAFKTTRAV